MKQVYELLDASKRSAIEIRCGLSYSILEEYFTPNCNKKLPKDITFKIVKGKKFYDLITYNQAGCLEFFSQKIIDIFSRHVDMSDKCYPIKIENCDLTYYVIYNLSSCLYFNFEYSKSFIGEEVDAILLPQGNTVSLFTLHRFVDDDEEKILTDKDGHNSQRLIDTFCKVVSDDIKREMINEGVTNIRFTECNGYNEEEYLEWKKEHGVARND